MIKVWDKKKAMMQRPWGSLLMYENSLPTSLTSIFYFQITTLPASIYGAEVSNSLI
jgi:hypothetical protein